MTFLNTLSLWPWLILALVPPAILALYFLKLKREPLEIPSTYLWSRTIEDLHVNSIWQRLRQSLLLFLQLLLIALLILALWRPGWRGTQLSGDRFVFLIDTSASMSATDVEPNRLAEAKRQVLAIIEQMESGDAAMVLSFSNVARVEQSFTDNRTALRQAVNQIQATQRPSDLSEALRAAAGLANPGRSSDAANMLDTQVADAQPATLYLFTDGGFAAVPDFSLGNLDPKYVPMGDVNAANVAIVAFTAGRNPEKPEVLQAYARIDNHESVEHRLRVSLYRDDQLIDSSALIVAAEGSSGIEFELPELDEGTLRLEVEHEDHLALDNVAYTAIGRQRLARVLAVTPGNPALRLALETDSVMELARVEFAEPGDLESPEVQQRAAAGFYDLLICDRCQPKEMPQANTLFLGGDPPAEGWKKGQLTVAPMIIDIDRIHPLMQYLDLGNVTILEGWSWEPPPGASVLIDADIGGLLTIAPRGGFEDVVLGFEILGTDAEGAVEPKTDWPIRRSFPVFIMNAVRYLGGVFDSSAAPSAQPGAPITLRLESPSQGLTVSRPDGREFRVDPQGQNAFVFSNTDVTGIYEVREGSAGQLGQRFAVNLFDSRESDLSPRSQLELGHEDVQAQATGAPARRELWRWVLTFALIVLVFEWYIYNRRVYL